MSDVLIQPVELRARGFEALVSALGWVNAVRFIQEYEPSARNYTAEREAVLGRVELVEELHLVFRVEAEIDAATPRR